MLAEHVNVTHLAVMVDQVEEVQEPAQAEQRCVQVVSQSVEVDKCGHVVHHVVYLREMPDV